MKRVFSLFTWLGFGYNIFFLIDFFLLKNWEESPYLSVIFAIINIVETGIKFYEKHHKK